MYTTVLTAYLSLWYNIQDMEVSMKLTHFDEGGNAHMVDVSQKDHTERVAVAEGFITLSEEAFHIVASGNVKKGDVLAVAQLAAIMGAMQT